MQSIDYNMVEVSCLHALQLSSWRYTGQTGVITLHFDVLLLTQVNLNVL